MPTTESMSESPLWRLMRWIVWGGAACLLLLPWVAMRYTEEVAWTPFDFVVMGILLGLVCGAFELTVRVARSHVYVIAAAIAVATGFVVTWINLAVGIIGSERHPANLMFFGVLAIGLIAIAFSRLQPLGMARAMRIMAIAQALVAVAAALLQSLEGTILSLLVAAVWLLSGTLFLRAARAPARIAAEA